MTRYILLCLFIGLLSGLTMLCAQTPDQPPSPPGNLPPDNQNFNRGPGPGGQAPGFRFPGDQFAYSNRQIQTGFIILNGNYLEPPYLLTLQDNQLYINNIPGPLPAPDQPETENNFDPGFRGWGRPGFGRGYFMAFRHLNNNGLVIAQDYKPLIYIPSYETSSVLDLLRQNDKPIDTRLELLTKMELESTDADLWKFLLQSFKPTEELNVRVDKMLEMQAQFNRIDETRIPQKNIQHMTWLGFALTVLALGILLNHRPPSLRKWHGINPSPLACRQVITLIALIVLLNGYDLLCTIHAQRFWGLWELNPLASSFIGNTNHTLLFKSALIIITATVLVLFRRYRLAQIGVWWTGIFYTVLVFRWSTSTSIFLN